MSPSRLYTPHDVVADFNYCAADGTIRDAATFKQRYLGIGDEYTRSMVVHDIRGREDEFELDRNGFKFVKLPIKERNMKDVDSITTEYYKEMEDVLKEVKTGREHLQFTYSNHCIRAAYQTKKEGGDPRDMAFPELNGPSGHPHCDYCGVPELVEGIKAVVPLPDNLRKLFDTCSRFSFMGTWRPIKTLQRDPLCVVDATTVPDSDYQLKVRSSNGMKGGNYIISHGSTEPQHKWYYMHAMDPHDLVVFKGYDTKQDQPGWRCPHNSFIIPNTDHLPPRESIECRALCFFD